MLLVEDDPVSQAFLAAATRALPAHVDTAGTIAAAMELAARHAYSLWLIDANLPDGTGADLLARLRKHDPATPAMAHTAAAGRNVALIDAGFVEVLIKPLPAAELHAALRRTLGYAPLQVPGAPSVNDIPLWDDAAALAALKGQQAHVDALRRLFLEDLPRTRDAIHAAAAREDFDGIRAGLHRLRASCGFVGAMQLGARVQDFEQAPTSTAALHGFAAAVDALIASV